VPLAGAPHIGTESPLNATLMMTRKAMEGTKKRKPAWAFFPCDERHTHTHPEGFSVVVCVACHPDGMSTDAAFNVYKIKQYKKGVYQYKVGQNTPSITAHVSGHHGPMLATLEVGRIKHHPPRHPQYCKKVTGAEVEA